MVEQNTARKRPIPQGTLTKNRTTNMLQLAQLAILCAALLWLTLKGAQSMGYNWQWYRVPRYIYRIIDGELIWGPLVKGLIETLKISAAAFVLAIVIGLATAILRLAPTIAGRALARSYMEVIRNTPLLIQLYLFYFVLAPIFDIDRYWTGILALAIFEGAFASEIFRAGILSVSRGQLEAARSLGLRPWSCYADIILPQAVRLMLPPFTNLAISLVKNSAIVSVIAVFELTTQGRNIISETYMSFEIWFTVAGMYLVVTILLSIFASLLEQRFAVRT